MRACSSSRASCHPLMVTDPTLSVVFLATIFLLPSSLYRKGTAQINLSDAVERVQRVEKLLGVVFQPRSEAYNPGFVVFWAGLRCFGPILRPRIGATTTFSTASVVFGTRPFPPSVSENASNRKPAEQAIAP